MSTLPKNIGVVIVGDEILSGKRQDKHLAKLIELLAARGLALSWARYVGDDRPRITEALQYAFSSGDLVFSCGGIGATPDDHTRQCAAAAAGLGAGAAPAGQGASSSNACVTWPPNKACPSSPSGPTTSTG